MEPLTPIHHERFLIGWEEWCALKKLGLPAIQAKIDTGAKTSALHAFDIEMYHRKDEKWVRFKVHPLANNKIITHLCHARLVDFRRVTNSGGQQEWRYVITTPLTLGRETWDIQITLTDRSPLSFRMLLGREALRGHVMIDPQKSHVTGKWRKVELRALYHGR